MPKKRFLVEQIIHHLREAEVLLSQGRTVGEVCRQGGLRPADGSDRPPGGPVWTLRLPSGDGVAARGRLHVNHKRVGRIWRR